MKAYLSLNETPEFPFWGLNIGGDFDFRDIKKFEKMTKLNVILFFNKNIDIHKTANPIRETQVT